MDNHEKLTELLTDEELMELAGGYALPTVSLLPTFVVAYGVVATIPFITKAISRVLLK